MVGLNVGEESFHGLRLKDAYVGEGGWHEDEENTDDAEEEIVLNCWE